MSTGEGYPVELSRIEVGRVEVDCCGWARGLVDGMDEEAWGVALVAMDSDV